MRLILTILTASLALAGCTETSKRIRFDGEFYRSNASAPRSDRHNFVVTSGPLSRGIEGARQAALYEGTRHCMTYYGTSKIDWAVHPTQDPVQALTIDGDRIVVQGRCVEWPEPGGPATR
ncbi:hypothetical protein ATO8_16108 [Roseivivax marinus]|uniref:Lipoprotein n=1 Tax=Roseivivax marinus TaxID=1379903 RepID=W4HG96_9RHOB|nr:hypothetical protein [Roseivivax marinus]ETW11787.1 hypothetical protein ATO8_16108 [Roseivivax marinus]